MSTWIDQIDWDAIERAVEAHGQYKEDPYGRYQGLEFKELWGLEATMRKIVDEFRKGGDE